MADTKLPKFRRPPVTEVLCCIYFQDLVELHAPQLGQLQAALPPEFKRTQTAPPLPPVTFSPAWILAQSLQAIADRYQLPRTLLIKEDDSAFIQVQRDRFVFNWRQSESKNEYPSYVVVIAEFKKMLDIFVKFTETARVGALSLTGMELAYVNHFSFGRELSDLSSIETVFPFFAWHKSGNPAFRLISGINWHTQFDLPDGEGQLHFTVQTAQSRAEGKPLLRSDLVARKLAPEIPLESIWAWFERAHIHIVTGFADVTGKEVQQNVWERLQ